MPPPEVQIIVAVLAFLGTVFVAWIGGLFSSKGSRPDTINSLGKRLDEAFERIDAQDNLIEELRDEVSTLRGRIRKETEERHKRKGAIISLVSVCRQLIRAIQEHFTDEQIESLPQPSRGHVRDEDGFEEYLQLARARERQA